MTTKPQGCNLGVNCWNLKEREWKVGIPRFKISSVDNSKLNCALDFDRLYHHSGDFEKGPWKFHAKSTDEKARTCGSYRCHSQ